MKKPDETLFRLIKSLTTSQKRNFRKFANRHGTAGEYLELFDEYDALPESDFDETTIAPKHKNLSNLKSYLFDKILDSMREFNPSEPVDLMEYWHSAFVLRAQGFHETGYEILKSGIEIGEARESHTALLQLYELRLQIAEVLPPYSEDFKLHEEIATRKYTIASTIAREAQYAMLLSKIRQSLRTRLSDPQEFSSTIVSTIFAHPLMAFELGSPTRIEVILKSFVFMSCGIWQGNYEIVELFGRKVWSLFEADSVLITEFPDKYLECGMILMVALRKNNKPDEADAVFEKAYSFFDKGKFLSVVAIERYSIIILHYLVSIKNTEKANGHLAKLQSGVAFNIKKLSYDWLSFYYFTLAIYYFDENNLREAKKWLALLFSLNRDQARRDMLIFGMLLELLVLIDTNDYEVGAHRLKSAANFLKNKGGMYQIEEIILDMFHDWLKASGKPDFNEDLLACQAKIETVKQNAFESRAFYYIDIESWLSEKIAR
jgi:tetratricopeptide (TPR) repeat protein